MKKTSRLTRISLLLFVFFGAGQVIGCCADDHHRPAIWAFR
jgi:hypothetical protein